MHMHGFAAGVIGSALIVVGLTYFSKKTEDYSVTRAIGFVLAGINFFIFSYTG